jgi:hypothetical protein
MTEKRVRMGSGIKIGRRRAAQTAESNERLKIPGSNADTNINGPTVSEFIDNDRLDIADIAPIFQDEKDKDQNAEGSPKDEPGLSPSAGWQLKRVASPDEDFLNRKKSPIDPPIGKTSKDDIANKSDIEGSNFELISGIEKSSGNYLLTLGYPGSGKTVLQSFLYYYLATHGDFSDRLELQREGSQSGHLTESLLNTWLTDWNNRRFPKATPEFEGAIREVRLQLTPKINTSRAFNFSFVEVSGEFIQRVIPTEVQPGSLVNTMHSFLIAPESKKIIVYVFDHKEKSNNDELFSSLLRYLERSVAGRLDQKYSLMIVVPNPDLVFQRVLSDKGRPHSFSSSNELQPEALLYYLRSRAPKLVATYRSWKKSKRGIFKFYIGPVYQNDLEQVLEKPDFQDCKRVIDFCYKQFHGSQLREGYLQRLVRWLRS